MHLIFFVIFVVDGALLLIFGDHLSIQKLRLYKISSFPVCVLRETCVGITVPKSCCSAFMVIKELVEWKVCVCFFEPEEQKAVAWTMVRIHLHNDSHNELWNNKFVPQKVLWPLQS